MYVCMYVCMYIYIYIYICIYIYIGCHALGDGGGGVGCVGRQRGRAVYRVIN
jgi:hypothetical protein